MEAMLLFNAKLEQNSKCNKDTSEIIIFIMFIDFLLIFLYYKIHLKNLSFIFSINLVLLTFWSENEGK